MHVLLFVIVYVCVPTERLVLVLYHCYGPLNNDCVGSKFHLTLCIKDNCICNKLYTLGVYFHFFT